MKYLSKKYSASDEDLKEAGTFWLQTVKEISIQV